MDLGLNYVQDQINLKYLPFDAPQRISVTEEQLMRRFAVALLVVLALPFSRQADAAIALMVGDTGMVIAASIGMAAGLGPGVPLFLDQWDSDVPAITDPFPALLVGVGVTGLLLLDQGAEPVLQFGEMTDSSAQAIGAKSAEQLAFNQELLEINSFVQTIQQNTRERLSSGMMFSQAKAMSGAEWSDDEISLSPDAAQALEKVRATLISKFSGS